MSGLTRCLGSSVGRKGLMAVTGILLSLFLIAHLVGNLLVYAGPDAVNHYAHALKSNAGLLWFMRGGLFFVFVTHIAMALSLTVENRRARPVKYVKEYTEVASVASRTMVLTGLLVLVYLVFHILHFTIGAIAHDAWASKLSDGSGQDVYTMVILGFKSPVLSLIYLLSMGLLYLHLSHGLKSFWQSLGWNHPVYRPLFEKIGTGLAAILVIGFSSIPLAILLGFIQLAKGGN
jgi:succinate dehydrogenase cytochrome b subunit